jgi:hypothetical protein
VLVSARRRTDSYLKLFGKITLLTHDDTNTVLRLLDAYGTVSVINDMSHATRPGLFKSITQRCRPR